MSFFESLRLLGRRRFGIFRARLLDRPATGFQRFPTPLRRHLGQAQFARHPTRRLAARPQAAVGRRVAQPNLQPLKQLLDPTPPERRHRRDLAGRTPLRKKPDRPETPRRRNVHARLATLFQRRNAQTPHDCRHVRLPRSTATKAIRWTTKKESHSVKSIRRKPYDSSARTRQHRFGLPKYVFASATRMPIRNRNSLPRTANHLRAEKNSALVETGRGSRASRRNIAVSVGLVTSAQGTCL